MSDCSSCRYSSFSKDALYGKCLLHSSGLTRSGVKLHPSRNPVSGKRSAVHVTRDFGCNRHEGTPAEEDEGPVNLNLFDDGEA